MALQRFRDAAFDLLQFVFVTVGTTGAIIGAAALMFSNVR
jgi:hypothetical protein